MPRFEGLGPKCCDENRFDSVKIECDWNYFDRIHAGVAREIMARCVLPRREKHNRSNWMIKRLNRYGSAVELSRPDHRGARQYQRYLVEVLRMHSEYDHIYLLAQGGDGTDTS